jgi:hypothetical protein
MVNHASLRDLEDAHQQERTTARKRIDLAEEYVAYYRSQVYRMAESFYELSAREGIADDPTFRTELQHVTDLADENTHRAGQTIGELEEDYQAMTSRHSHEHESFLEEQRAND